MIQYELRRKKLLETLKSCETRRSQNGEKDRKIKFAILFSLGKKSINKNQEEYFSRVFHQFRALKRQSHTKTKLS